jgi:hypothetical protein
MQEEAGTTEPEVLRLESLGSSPVHYGDRDNDSDSIVSETSTMASIKSKTLSTTDAGFRARATSNGILFHAMSEEPSNIADIRAQLDAELPVDEMPPKERFVRYQQSRRLFNINEATMVNLASIYLLKIFDDKNYESVWDRAISGIPASSGCNRGLSPPKPGILQGYTIPAFTERRIEVARMFTLASFKDDPHSLVLPHLAGEFKSPSADQALATVQSGYDGAVLVEARMDALQRMDTRDEDKHAFVLTFTFNGTNLYIFAHYASISQTTSPPTLQHHQFPVAELSLLSSNTRDEDYATFLRLCQLLQNAQKFAKTQAEKLLESLAGAALANTLRLDPLPLSFTPTSEPTSSNKRRKAGLGISQVSPPPRFPDLQ